jgi:hypothetical protein
VRGKAGGGKMTHDLIMTQVQNLKQRKITNLLSNGSQLIPGEIQDSKIVKGGKFEIAEVREQILQQG